MYGPSPAAPTRFKRKKKTKTFSGCWTCRARRIKCDERRPICERCSRSGFDCEGYGVRLLWMNARHHGRTGSEEMPLHQAQERLSVRNHCGYSNRTDLNDFGSRRSPFLERTTIRPISPALRESIADFSNHTNYSIGNDNGEAQSDKDLCSLPIDSQFPPEPSLNVHVEGLRMDGSSQPTPPNTVQRLAQLFNPIPREREPGDNESSFSGAFLFSQHGDNCSAATSPFELDHHRSQIRSDPELDEEFSFESSIDDNITHTNDIIPISNKLTAREDSGSLENMDPPSSYRQPTGLHSTIVALNYHKDSFMIKRSPLLIQEPTCSSPQKALIHHWIFGLCKNMVPVDLVHNPFRGVYLPFMFNSLDSPVTRSSNLAIFHGICAVSAENLICLGKGRPEVNEPIATLHNYLAVKHLQSALQIQPRIDDIAPIFTAILICILRDTVTGQAWNWRRHIQGALSCIPNPREIRTVQPGSSLHIVLEQLLCLSIFGNVTTTYDLFALIDRIPESLSYMNQYHGVNKFMLQSVLRINQYAATLDTQHPTTMQHERARKDFNNSFVDLEYELMAYLHAPASISLEIHHHRDGIIALHYRHVYYIALLVHFKRKVHRVSIGSMEEMVGRAIRHLELAEEAGASSNGCIWLWPCLVVTAECNTLYTKSRALAWFKLKKRHGFKNVNTGARILEKFWKWRDENPEKASYTNWQSFIQETEEDVVPL